MIKAGILGSTGYAGSELVRLLTQHPQVEIAFVDSRSYGGVPFSQVYPHLRGFVDRECSHLDYKDPTGFEGIDVLFCALPHGLTQEVVAEAMKSSVRIVDLSADFRLADPAVFEEWYATPHVAPEALSQAVYGLPEVHRQDIAAARLVANPGCYPTSIILALYPLLKDGLISGKELIADSASGVSGAGRSLSDGNLYSQVQENFSAYKVGSHRHTPEIEQELSLLAGEKVTLQFTPHLAPMARGILSTIYAKNTGGATRSDLENIYRKYYEAEPFLRLLPEGVFPKTKEVAGTNLVDISFVVDERTGNLILLSAIDNLIKGAAGQAVQNMNLMFGFDETEGLRLMPQWP